MTGETQAVNPQAGTASSQAATYHEPEQYKFDSAFQSKIAALCLRDTQFMQRVDGLIKPDYFENLAEAAAVKLALTYYGKFKKCPGDLTTVSALIKQDLIQKTLGKDLAATAWGHVKANLFTTDISDRDFVVEEVASFSRYQAVSRAILDSVGHLDIREFSKISKVMQEALNVGENGDSAGYDYGEMVDARTQERLDRASGKLAPTGITTGHADLDKHLYHKGWGKRELSVLMAPAKGGKTTALIDFGISACASINKYNVLYVSLEVSAKIISERLDARVSSYMMNELNAKPHEIKDKVKRFMSQAGKFIIHEFPTGSMKASDLRRLVERYKAKGIKFDMVIVDYADLMAPERYVDDSIENSKGVYVALRGFAMLEDIAVLTATQTNREGAKKMVSTMTDVAEDFNKIRIADIVISINKTEEERKSNQARLFFAAVRNGPSGFTLRVAQDLARMRFISAVVGEE